jgi:hypothetical protein
LTFARAILIFSAVAWAGFGVALLIRPDLTDVGLQVMNPDGNIEIRGFYGGLELGIAAFLSWSAMQPARYRSGLMAAILIVGCLASGRIVGIVIEGGTSALILGFLSCEIVGAGLGIWALRGLPSDS